MKQHLAKAAGVMLLGLGSLASYAQTDSVNISTGVNTNINGKFVNHQPSGQWDANWTCLRPNQGYMPILIGSGKDPAGGSLVDYDLIYGSKLIVPYAVMPGTTSDPCKNYGLNNYDIQPALPMPGAPGNCSTWDVPLGKYYYKRKFNLDVPSCHGILTASIDIRKLAALDYVDEIYINAHSLSVSAYASATHLDNSDANYSIPINPTWLVPGGNNTIIFTAKKTNGSRGTAFLLDAKIVYTLWSGSAPAGVSFTGTTAHACPGSPAQVKVNITNYDPMGTNTYTVKLYGLSGGVYSQVGSALTNVSTQNAGTFWISSIAHQAYKVEVTLNSSGLCTGQYFVPLATNCATSVFNPVINMSPSQISVMATPLNANEAALPGFEQKWAIHELEPADLSIGYSVPGPSCWSLGPDEVQRFEGFNGLLHEDYLAEYKASATVALTCNKADGIFKPHHIYQLERSVKTTATPWETYSTIIRPGAPAEFSITSDMNPSGYYNIEAVPSDFAWEPEMEGFEQKWTLEELDPLTMDVLYTINETGCWNVAAGEKNTFDNFDPVSHDYLATNAEVGGIPFSILCEGTDVGVFESGHLYRITRAVRSDDYDWTVCSKLYEPGAFAKSGGAASQKPADIATTITDVISSGSVPAITVYPNPGTGMMMIRNAGNGTATIYDALGKKVKQFELKGNAAGEQVDLTELPKGFYSLNMTSNGKISVIKIVLQ